MPRFSGSPSGWHWKRSSVMCEYAMMTFVFVMGFVSGIATAILGTFVAMVWPER